MPGSPTSRSTPSARAVLLCTIADPGGRACRAETAPSPSRRRPDLGRSTRWSSSACREPRMAAAAAWGCPADGAAAISAGTRDLPDETAPAACQATRAVAHRCRSFLQEDRQPFAGSGGRGDRGADRLRIRARRWSWPRAASGGADRPRWARRDAWHNRNGGSAGSAWAIGHGMHIGGAGRCRAGRDQPVGCGNGCGSRVCR